MVGLKNALAEEEIGKAPSIARHSSLLADRRWSVSLACGFACIRGRRSVCKGRIARTSAEYALRDRALAAFPLAADSLKGDVEKQRVIPLVLARDGAVREMLRSPSTANEATLDNKVPRHSWKRHTGAADYVTYDFQLALSRRRSRGHLRSRLLRPVWHPSDRIVAVGVVNAELTRLKVMTPQARFAAP
ncbi:MULTISPECIES: hypothetical protein [Mesorhizobium]|uniref:hypothetical protein n=1 Tax=Mesorhizobium TaxID=68287 RepID=UPI001FD90F6E|nr:MULTISPECIES: hypothetical protein [Mesorhizobium]